MNSKRWLGRMTLVLPGLLLGLSVCAAVVIGQDDDKKEPEKKKETPKERTWKNKPDKDNNFIGAAACKTCHDKEDHGKQYSKWKEARHSKAFETLGSDAAKKIAKEKGIEDPQKDANCLKCHVTAYTQPKELKHKKFKDEDGVQCETCHGPGENHKKVQLKAAMGGDDDDDEDEYEYEPLPEDEITLSPKEETCRTCHNEESPSYKEFNFKKFAKKIRHWDPRKEREDEKDEEEADEEEGKEKEEKGDGDEKKDDDSKEEAENSNAPRNTCSNE